MIKLSPALLHTLQQPHERCTLLSIELDQTSLHFTASASDVNYGGIRYVAGVFYDAPAIEYSAEPKVNELTLKLDATQQDVSAVFMHANWLNRKVKLLRAYFVDGMLIDVFPVWSGLITGKSGDESPTRATLPLKAASIWADFSASRGRKTNQASQQIYFPNDKGFEFSGRLINDIPWGRKGAVGAAVTSREVRGTSTEVVQR